MSRILVTLLPWFYCGGRGVLLMLLYTVLQILARGTKSKTEEKKLRN